MMYYVNKFAWALLNPAMMGLLAAGVCWMLSRHRIFRLTGFLALAWLWIWCTPLMTCLVGMSLERDYVVLQDDGSPRMREAAEYPACDAIVDLGGGTGTLTNFYFGVQLNSSADRVYFSAQLWKAGKAPIVIPTGEGCVLSDGQFLQDLGVPASAILPENCARNTEENAKFVACLLTPTTNDQQLTTSPKVLLVTSAWHMKRSLLMFEKYAPELEVVPAPCDFECVNWINAEFSSALLLPSFDVAGRNSIYFHEWLGYWWYKWVRN